MKNAILASATLASLIPTFTTANEVNLYSYREPSLMKPITDAFEKETGIEVNVAYLKKGMIEKLKAEGKRTPADVVLTVDISRLSKIVDEGLTQPIESTDTNLSAIPENYRDPDGHWLGITTRARIIYASKQRVKVGEITTYEDLADPKWKGRICMRSGLNAYNVALTSAMIEHHGEEYTETWLTNLRNNLSRKPQGNDRAQVKAIWAGECDISIGNTYYMGKMLEDAEQKDWANSVNVLFPKFENGGTHINISGVAITKYSKNKENALKFINFLTSPSAQEIYANANYEYPVSKDVPLNDIVSSWGTFTPDDVNLMELAKQRSQALKITEIVDFDR